MRSLFQRTSLGLAAVGFCFGINLNASAQTGDPGIFRLDADKNALLDFGDSWKRSAFAPAGESCVEIDLENAKELGDNADETSYKLVTSSQEIADEMSLSVDAKFSGITQAGKVSAHAAVDFAQSIKTNSSSVSLMVKAAKTNGTVRLEGVKLKDKYVKMLDGRGANGLKQFERECGDGFVIGKKQGAMFVGVANASSTSTKSFSEFDMAVGGGLTNPGYAVEANVGTAQAMSKAFGSKNVTVEVYGNYDFSSGDKASSPEDLERIWKKWKPGSNFADISYQIADYKKWVTNWPDSQKSTPWKSIKEQDLDDAVSAAWDLLTLEEEAQFTIDNKSLFALGVSEKVRSRELKRVKALRDEWKKQRREVAAYAKQLMEKGGTGAKKPSFLRGFELTELRGQLPVRYVNDCKANSVDLAKLAAQNVQVEIPHHKGDKNLGGKGALVTGEFVVKLDEKSNLVGRFKSLSVRECKKHKSGKKKGKCKDAFKTEFKLSKAIPSFDAPMAKASPQYGDVSLAGCSLKGGAGKFEFRKHFEKFGRGSEITPNGKARGLNGLKCNLDKKAVKNMGAILCEVRFGRLDSFVNSADLALETDPKAAVKKRQALLKKIASPNLKKAKKKKSGLLGFLNKSSRGKKAKAKRSKGKKGKKSCQKKCGKKKGKKKKACLKKCK